MTAVFLYGVLVGLLGMLIPLAIALASRSAWKREAGRLGKSDDWWRAKANQHLDAIAANGLEIGRLKDEVREADEGLKVQSDEIERCHAELTAIEAELAEQKNCNERQRETISDQAERIAKLLDYCQSVKRAVLSVFPLLDNIPVK